MTSATHKWAPCYSPIQYVKLLWEQMLFFGLEVWPLQSSCASVPPLQCRQCKELRHSNLSTTTLIVKLGATLYQLSLKRGLDILASGGGGGGGWHVTQDLRIQIANGCPVWDLGYLIDCRLVLSAVLAAGPESPGCSYQRHEALAHSCAGQAAASQGRGRT